MNPVLFMFIILAVAIFLHIPIGFALGVASVGTVLFYQLVPASFIIQTYFNSAYSFTLLAIPFFILAGDIMLYGGISDRLVNLGKSLFGHKTGALGVITVFCCMIFAALSGSGPATAAAIGGILIPAMVRDGYDGSFSATLAGAAGALGPIIPPSIMFAIYGNAVGTSITDLFAAGMLPGIVMGLVLMGYCVYVSKKHGFGTVAPKQSGRDRLKAFINAFWALLAPLIILGGIYTGIFTPTEAAIVSCAYSLIISVFVYRSIKLKDIFEILARSGKTTGTCLILLGGANLFGRVLTLERIPAMLADAITSFTDSRALVLLIMVGILFLAGMFMESIAAILILGPLMSGVVAQYGVSDLHFGVIMILTLSVGLCTPPVGVNLFVTSRIAGTPLEKMIKWLVPMVILLMAVVLLFTYCEPLVNLGPDLVSKIKIK